VKTGTQTVIKRRVDGTDSASGVSDAALAFTAAAGIQDAVAAADAVTEPYGVAVTEVTDPTLADVTLNMDTTSAVGSYAAGVLGCTTDARRCRYTNHCPPVVQAGNRGVGHGTGPARRREPGRVQMVTGGLLLRVSESRSNRRCR
jgi:hypothetical protein